MSSAQCQKPIHEHKFTDKVKELATSVTKVFTEHKHQHGHQSCHVTSKNHHTTVKLHDGKKKEGHCLPQIGDHKKHMMKKKNKNRECRCSDSSSDSSSESEDEARQKRTTT